MIYITLSKACFRILTFSGEESEFIIQKIG